MTADNNDPLISALRALSSDPPRRVVNMVFASWVTVSGPAGELYVAFTDHGVNFVRTAESVHGDDAEFLREYRERFGRPLRKATRPPAGLLPTLRGRSSQTLRLDLRGLTALERDTLEATRRIPVGQTRPYGWLAREIGRPSAVRAVGTALRRNPVPVLVPCHRVTTSTGELGDYLFGAEMKERLLRAEKVNLDEVHALAKDNVYYLGSKTTGIVCFPTCSDARRITREHRRGFRTIDQAASAGYRPCKRCRPAVAEPA
ncbi:MAG: methylated-DNA--[protein]-cysteine S-methyltransferase [Pseudonocardiaceae bacterium]